jgi:hypothetical protein
MSSVISACAIAASSSAVAFWFRKRISAVFRPARPTLCPAESRSASIR